MRQKPPETPEQYLEKYEARLKSNPWAQYLKRRKHQLKESEHE